MFNIKVNDELGTHILQSDRDCTFVCRECGEELDVKEHHIKEGCLSYPKCPKCHAKMKFTYWLDNLYSEEEYKKLLNKSKRDI